MPRYAAFLRAVNVGGRILKMDRLRALLEEIGFTDVETFIASGNVVLSAPARGGGAVERAIQRHLESSLGYPVTTFARTLPELRELAACDPFPGLKAGGYHALYVAFLPSRPAAAAAARLLAHRSSFDEFCVRGREAWWLSRAPMSQTPFTAARLEKALGLPATLRNVTTVKRMAEKYCR